MPDYNKPCNCNQSNSAARNTMPGANTMRTGTARTGGVSPAANNGRYGRMDGSCNCRNRQSENYMRRAGQMNGGMQAGCPSTEDHMMAGMPIGMGYVPWQVWQDICEAGAGFCAGTIFAQLDLPFTECACGGGRK